VIFLGDGVTGVVGDEGEVDFVPADVDVGVMIGFFG
jgi:hypothetical protein